MIQSKTVSVQNKKQKVSTLFFPGFVVVLPPQTPNEYFAILRYLQYFSIPNY